MIFWLKATREIDRTDRFVGYGSDIIHKDLVAFLDLKIGRQFLLQVRGIGEGKLRRRILQEEIERVEDADFKDQIDLDAEMRGFFREDDARQPVAERVLLPVEEVAGGLDFQRIGLNVGAGMRRRAQADDLGPQGDRPVVAIVGNVMQRRKEAH